MDPTSGTKDTPTKDPALPKLCKIGDIIAPKAPQDIASMGLEDGVLLDLAVKLAGTTPQLTAEWMSQKLHVSLAVAAELLEKMSMERMAEALWSTGSGGNRYRITDRGREHAARALEACGYIGPAPVRLDAYSAMLRWQFANTPQVQPEHVASALSGLVITPEAAQLAGLAASSGRSLFVFGPPGNGKSSVGRQLRAALPGDYWIPYCLSAGTSVIRLYDEHSHQRAEFANDKSGAIDHRWVRIRRPLVIVGGELTLQLLDLVWSPTMRYYEAPPHLKANGGVFLVDDFGRERVSPEQLLNRFIIPMEYQVDYFMLQTGQKIMVPLYHVLIIATNLNPELVTDPAFLRRMGYRLYLGPPTPEQYARIFQQYAHKVGATVEPEVISGVLERYRAQKRELRCCEPRDLIERSRDICRFQGRPLQLTSEILDLAWTGYFGNQQMEG
jgi:predicted ATPase with chaperone activity